MVLKDKQGNIIDYSPESALPYIDVYDNNSEQLLFHYLSQAAIYPDDSKHLRISHVLNTSINEANYESLNDVDKSYLQGMNINFMAGKLDEQGQFEALKYNGDGIGIVPVSAIVPLEHLRDENGNAKAYRVLSYENPINWEEDHFISPAVYYGALDLYGPDGKRSRTLALQALFKSDDSAKEQFLNDNFEIKLTGDDIKGWSLKVVKKDPSAPNPTPAPAPAPAAKAEPVVAPKPVFKRKALDLRYARDDFYNKNGVYKPVSLLYGPYKSVVE
ncbi:MAG: hypothetical protein Q4E22_03545 [Coriobacteriia bacterium]|nr:hypothetical protein [Coriobacteriia bacterium]